VVGVLLVLRAWWYWIDSQWSIAVLGTLLGLVLTSVVGGMDFIYEMRKQVRYECTGCSEAVPSRLDDLRYRNLRFR